VAALHRRTLDASVTLRQERVEEKRRDPGRRQHGQAEFAQQEDGHQFNYPAAIPAAIEGRSSAARAYHVVDDQLPM
jgi:hypothetical protein